MDYHVIFTLDVRIRVTAESAEHARRLFQCMNDADAVREGTVLDTRDVSVERAP